MARLALCLLLVLAAPARSQTPQSPKAGDDWVKALLVGESLLIGASWLTSSAPNEFGIVAAVLIPYAVRGNEPYHWTMLISAEALAFYNIQLDEDEKSRREVFRDNLIGWHLAIGATAAVAYFTGALGEDVEVRPAGGDGLSLNYSVSFR